MSSTSKLSPTVYLPVVRAGDLPTLDAEMPLDQPAGFPASPADAVPNPAHEVDFITGVSLTFDVLPLRGATAVRGFEPFALP